MTFKIESGEVFVNGAHLKTGYSRRIYSPLHLMPLCFSATSTFSMTITPIDVSTLNTVEEKFYTMDTCKEYQQIAPMVYFSKGDPTKYDDEVLNTVEQLSKQQGRQYMMVIGPKKSGKSTFCRYLVNKFLNNRKNVYYVDLDPGQPEFSLPGTLSFTVVDEYVLNPPDKSINKLDTTSYYHGSVSMKANERSFDIILKILDSLPKSAAVVINSLGYLNDDGIALHRDLINIFKPKTLFYMQIPNSDVPNFGELVKNYVMVPMTILNGPRNPEPKELRDLRIISYLTKEKQPIAYQQPIPIPLSSVRMAFSFRFTDYNQVLNLLTGSLVFLVNDHRNYPPRKKAIAITRNTEGEISVGCGIVKAIDVDKGILYLITPVQPNAFNTISVPDFPVPSRLILDSPRCQIGYLNATDLSKKDM